MKIPVRIWIVLALAIFMLGVGVLYKSLNITGLSPARFTSLAIMFAIVVIIVAMQVLRRMAGQYMLDKGLKALNRECDPVTAIESHTQKLAAARAKGEKAAEMLFLNNLAVAYHANGETERALDLLSGANAGQVNPAMQMVHNGNVAILNWDAGNYDEFWHKKTVVDNYVQELSNKSPAYQAICRQMERISARADILNGDYERALGYFSRQMQTIPAYDMYARVSNCYIMAGIYYLMGDTANYRKSLEFVAQNGNKLNVARLARERLAALNQIDMDK